MSEVVDISDEDDADEIEPSNPNMSCDMDLDQPKAEEQAAETEENSTTQDSDKVTDFPYPTHLLPYQEHLIDAKRSTSNFAHVDSADESDDDTDDGRSSYHGDPANLAPIAEHLAIKVMEYIRKGCRTRWSKVAADINEEHGRQANGRQCRDFFVVKVLPSNKQSRPSRSPQGLGKLLAKRQSGFRFERRVQVEEAIHHTLIRNMETVTAFKYGSGSVVDMALKQDGKEFKLAIGCAAHQDIYNQPGNLLMADLGRGTVKRLKGHKKRIGDTIYSSTVTDVKMSFSKEYLFSASDDGCKIWDTKTDTQVLHIGKDPERINRLAVCSQPLTHMDILATCSTKGSIRVHKISSGGGLEHSAHTNAGRVMVSSLTFCNGQYWDILVAGLEGTGQAPKGQLHIYDTQMEAKTSEIHLEKSSVSDTNTSISCVTSSSSGRYIACGTSGSSEGDEDDQGDGLIRIYDTHRAKIAQVAYSGQVDVNEVSFSPCENYIVSAAADNTAIVFDRRFLGSVNKSYFEKLSPVWDQRASRPVHILRHEVFEDEPADAGLTSMLWCNGMIPQMSGYWQGFKESGGFGARPYGSRTVLATGGGDSVVRVWDLGRATEDAEMMTWETRGGPIGSMVATPDFDQLFVGGDIGQVTMISMDRNLKDQYCKVPLRMLEDD